MAGSSKQKSDAEWRDFLPARSYLVLRKKCTQFPHTGVLHLKYEEGIYQCGGCSTHLYNSSAKLNSEERGVPVFSEAASPSLINQTAALDGERTRLSCAACDGHIGYLGEHQGALSLCHIVNCASLSFTKDKPAA